MENQKSDRLLTTKYYVINNMVFLMILLYHSNFFKNVLEVSLCNKIAVIFKIIKYHNASMHTHKYYASNIYFRKNLSLFQFLHKYYLHTVAMNEDHWSNLLSTVLSNHLPTLTNLQVSIDMVLCMEL